MKLAVKIGYFVFNFPRVHTIFTLCIILQNIRKVLSFYKVSSKLMHISCKPPKMGSETQRVSQIFVSKMNTFRMYIKIMHIIFVPNTIFITIANILYFNKLSSKLMHISYKPPKMGSETQRVSQIFV